MTSNPIYTPTFLYIKRHSVTGKLYFGKTVRDPEKYDGSGLHWKRHIKIHGKEHVETLWYCLFLDQESCTEFALNFSRQNNIVESDEWLNLQEENGIDGTTPGTKQSEEFKRRRSELMSRENGINPFQNEEFIRKNAARNSARLLEESKNGTHIFQNEEFREEQGKRISERNKSRGTRQNVKELGILVRRLGISLGRGWNTKSNEWIDSKILELSPLSV